MKQLEKAIPNLVFGMLCMLTVLLAFEDWVALPAWIQAVGRMHPLVLHFPIVLIVLLLVVHLAKPYLASAARAQITQFLLLSTALTTTLAAVMGFFLAQEGGYATEAMQWHKWSGLAVSYLVYILWLMRKHQRVYALLLYSGAGCTLVAGHLGATLTHGEGFLTAPFMEKASPNLITENETVFAALVAPVLKSKCLACHNAQKQKGGLDMSALTKMAKGGKNGPLWVAGDAQNSALIQRILLPLNDDDHMPPKGKSQLNDWEVALLESWIDQGAQYETTIASLDEGTALHRLAQQKMTAQRSESTTRYTFAYADKALLASLNNPYRHVAQQSPQSPAVEASIFGRQAYQPHYLSELSQIGEQITALSLARLPITDESLGEVAKMPNLEKLDLSFSKVTDQGLEKLKDCKNLTSLALSGTAVTLEGLAVLKDWKHLKEVFLWNTAIGAESIQNIKSRLPGVVFVLGYQKDTEDALPLNPPFLKSKKTIIDAGEAVVLAHKLKKAVIRYTTDGSTPDSTAQVYSQPLQLTENTELKVRAYMPGWLPSKTESLYIYQKGVKPQAITYVTVPSQQYPGNGVKSLIDNERGGLRDLPGFPWLGYIDTAMVAAVDFGEKPPQLSQIALGYGVDINRWVMAPVAFELWGGSSPDQLQLIEKYKPIQTIEDDPKSRKIVQMPLSTPQSYQYYQVVAQPIARLPSWHRGAGKKGWVFVDQLFFYEM